VINWVGYRIGRAPGMLRRPGVLPR